MDCLSFLQRMLYTMLLLGKQVLQIDGLDKISPWKWKNLAYLQVAAKTIIAMLQNWLQT